MLDKENLRPFVARATAVFGLLTMADLSVGFVLSYYDYISMYDFGVGLGIGVSLTATCLGATAFAFRDRFYKPAPIRQDEVKINENELESKLLARN